MAPSNADPGCAPSTWVRCSSPHEGCNALFLGVQASGIADLASAGAEPGSVAQANLVRIEDRVDCHREVQGDASLAGSGATNEDCRQIATFFSVCSSASVGSSSFRVERGPSVSALTWFEPIRSGLPVEQLPRQRSLRSPPGTGGPVGSETPSPRHLPPLKIPSCHLRDAAPGAFSFAGLIFLHRSLVMGCQQAESGHPRECCTSGLCPYSLVRA